MSPALLALKGPLMVSWILLLCLAPAPELGAESPPPANSQHIEMAYEFHVGPLHVLSIQATLQLSESSYVLTSLSETHGITDFLFRMTNETTSIGSLQGGRLVPSAYSQSSDSRWGEWMVGMTYESGDVITLETDPDPKDRGVVPVSDEEMANTLDPMTAFLLGAREAKPGECDQDIAVFDGRRRFDLDFSAADPKNVSTAEHKNLPDEDNYFWCQLKFHRISGFEEDPDDDNDRQKRRDEPMIMRLGHFEQGKITIPVYGQIKSGFGTARARLIELKIDGVQLFEESAN